MGNPFWTTVEEVSRQSICHHQQYSTMPSEQKAVGAVQWYGTFDFHKIFRMLLISYAL